MSEAADAGDGTSASPTGSGSPPQPSETTGAAVRWGVGSGSYWTVGAAVVAALV